MDSLIDYNNTKLLTVDLSPKFYQMYEKELLENGVEQDSI
jgi:hypothetical protein